MSEYCAPECREEAMEHRKARRQVALEQAVIYATPFKMHRNDVLLVAKHFDHFLRTGEWSDFVE